MTAKQEFLSGGLVTTREGSLLQPGELQVAEDVLLKPGDLSIYKAPGRVVVPGGNISAVGLAFCAFDGAIDRLAAVANHTYYTIPAEGGALTTLSTKAGTSLDTASLTNRTVLMSGGTNKVLLKDGTIRDHGLLPVTTSPGLEFRITAGGTWPLGSTQLGWFEYWTTEVYITKDADGKIIEEVESTFAGTPAQINVTQVSPGKVIITRPGMVNLVSGTDTTNWFWRVYRGLKRGLATDITSFPVGFKIGEIPAATGTFEDGGGATIAFQIATTGDNNVLSGDMVENSETIQRPGNWQFPGRVTALDGSLAISNQVFADSNDYEVSAMRAGGFGLLPAAVNPITGITVEVVGLRVGEAALQAALSWNGGTSWTVSRPFQQLGVGLTTATAGSATDTWGRTWTATELDNSTFFVRIEAYPTVQFAVGVKHIEVDSVRVSVVHGGTSALQDVPFPRIIISAGRSTTSVGSHGKPPSATTGDIFQGSLVTNDVDHPTEVAWTIPGTIDYSPVPYRLSIDTKNKDSVKCIRALSNVLLVGSEGQVHRMNFLPLEDDPEFNTGRCVELVDADDGMVGPLAACTFVMSGELRLFYIGRNSLRVTNGFNAERATNDISWVDMIDVTKMTRCRAVNNALYSEIKVYFPDIGGVFRVLRLNYHSTHLKDGKLKVVGITKYSANAGATGINASGDRVEYTSADVIYQENIGIVDPSGVGITPRAKTRDMGDVGTSWELDQLGIQHQDNAGAVVSVNYDTSLANYPNRNSVGGDIIMDDDQTSIITRGETGDSIAIDLIGQDDGRPWTIDFLTLFPSQQGETAPLKR